MSNESSPPPGSGRFEAEWRARFDRFAARGGSLARVSGWSEHGLARRLEEVREALRRHPLPPGARVLDLGCGTGVYGLMILESGYRPVEADFSAGMLERARATLGEAGAPEVPLVGADLLALPFGDGVFDGLVNVGVLQHVEDGARALREMTRVLAPGGRLVLVTLNKVSLHGVAGHALALLRAWRSGRLRPRKHAVRRRPVTLRKVAEAAGARVVDLRGVYLFPRGLRALERVLRRLDFLRLGAGRAPLFLPLANAFLVVIEKPAQSPKVSA